LETQWQVITQMLQPLAVIHQKLLTRFIADVRHMPRHKRLQHIKPNVSQGPAQIGRSMSSSGP
jgi:hypothetical protein